ncbi:MAG: DUF4276 family protein [Nitrospirae bacterium]|nr:DUF4276 family protein [Nitrospirota bacterium]
MKIMLLVEGATEKKALPGFFKRWLDKKSSNKIGIDAVKIDNIKIDLINRASNYLKGHEVIAVIGIVDIYELKEIKRDGKDREEYYLYAKQEIEKRVGHEMFFQFFAVHETEAWLLSDPNIFPRQVQEAIRQELVKKNGPESVNFDTPPAKLLDRLYRKELNRKYNKITDGNNLFTKLAPDTAYSKCPYLKQILDKLNDICEKHNDLT